MLILLMNWIFSQNPLHFSAFHFVLAAYVELHIMPLTCVFLNLCHNRIDECLEHHCRQIGDGTGWPDFR